MKRAYFHLNIWLLRREVWLEVRTTNACESFHSFFNQSFYKHTSKYEVQTDIYIKMRSISILKTPHDAKNVERQRRNEAYIKEYKNSKICRYKFVKQISYNYKK